MALLAAHDGKPALLSEVLVDVLVCLDVDALVQVVHLEELLLRLDDSKDAVDPINNLRHVYLDCTGAWSHLLEEGCVLREHRTLQAGLLLLTADSEQDLQSIELGCGQLYLLVMNIGAHKPQKQLQVLFDECNDQRVL